MSVPVLNTRAVIEDYEKGKIGEIIFDSYGENKDYIILCPEKLAYIIGRDMIDVKAFEKRITSDDIAMVVDDNLEEIRDEITKYLTEYIENNYDGEYIEWVTMILKPL